MKLNFTRKTWYFFLLASAAVSMLNGFFVLAGQTFGRWASRKRSTCCFCS